MDKPKQSSQDSAQTPEQAGSPSSRKKNRRYYYLAFAIILMVGIFVRTWEFGSLPPGLNQDEAVTGVEAYSIFRYGVDHNGVSYPTYFIAFGSGQSPLLIYLLVPFVALGGLSPFTVRLPLLISGILTLPLVYFVAQKSFNKKFALIAMAFVAISPWHILLSRWGLEANFLPFIFLLGYTCLILALKRNGWFIAACGFFALSLHSYGPAMAMVPVFLATSLVMIIPSKKIAPKYLVAGLAVLVTLSTPVLLYVAINSLKLNSIHLGPVTIPRLPAQPRFATEGAIFGGSFFKTIFENLKTLLQLLIKQTDGLVWNTVEPYGYFYTLTFPIAVFGIILLVYFYGSKRFFQNKKTEMALLSAWLAAAVVLNVLQYPNINRTHILFIPLLFCMALALFWVMSYSNIATVTFIGFLLICFIDFTAAFHGEEYRQKADPAFFDRFLPAVEFASQSVDQPICVTGNINMPYIYVLFAEKPNPASYLAGIDYVDPAAPFRQVRALGRYHFGLENCPPDPRTVFVVSDGEYPPATTGGRYYIVTDFTRYQVYKPAMEP